MLNPILTGFTACIEYYSNILAGILRTGERMLLLSLYPTLSECSQTTDPEAKHHSGHR